MRGVEDLLTQVRDARSREHLADAVSAFNAGALRAAIISTWVAVALDLTSKIRELGELGEPAARRYVSELDAAIASEDVRGLSRIESQLLDACRDIFELIEQREHIELSRLFADRHVCAHPAYVSPDVVFTPTAELCRAHLATAVDAVLRHPPTPGRKALERFMNEARDKAWPETPASLAAHLKARYLDRGKDSLRRNLAQVIVKGCLEAPEDEEALAVRMAEAARALDAVAPELLAKALRDIVTRREETSGLTEGNFLRLTGALGDLSVMWDSLPNTSRPRTAAAVRAATVEQLAQYRITSVSIQDEDTNTALADNLATLGQSELARLVTAAPGRPLVQSGLELLDGSGSWRGAERVMGQLVVPLAAWFTAGDVSAIGATLRSNNQVREASGMPPMLDAVFAASVRAPGALEVWTELAAWLSAQGREGPDDWFSYPQLSAAVAQYRAES